MDLAERLFGTKAEQAKNSFKEDVNLAWMFVNKAEENKSANPGLTTHFFVLALQTILQGRKECPDEERAKREEIASKIMRQAKEVKAIVNTKVEAVMIFDAEPKR